MPLITLTSHEKLNKRELRRLSYDEVRELYIQLRDELMRRKRDSQGIDPTAPTDSQ